MKERQTLSSTSPIRHSTADGTAVDRHHAYSPRKKADGYGREVDEPTTGRAKTWNVEGCTKGASLFSSCLCLAGRIFAEETKGSEGDKKVGRGNGHPSGALVYFMRV